MSQEIPLEIVGDDSDQKSSPENSPTGGVLEKGNVDDAWKNVVRDIPSIRLKPSPSAVMNVENILEVPTAGSGKNGSSESGSAMSMMDEAWEQLRKSYVTLNGWAVGTVAAITENETETLNYDQVTWNFVDTCVSLFHTYDYS